MNREVIYQNHKICVNVEGSGEVLLFLHGWPTNAWLWQAQQDFFKAHYQVITPDWLGFGQSDKPTDHHYSFASMKSMVDAILEQLLKAEEKLTIIAHDIGGPVALLWANEYPERVHSLILLNTVFYPFQTPLDKLGHFFFVLPGINRIQMSNFGLRSLMQHLIKNKGNASRARICEILQRQQPWPHQLRRRTILEPFDKNGKKLTENLARIFRELAVDRHLIIAREDPLCYAHMQRIHEENPEVPAYFLEGCGHFISIDRPDELNHILRQILTTAVGEPQMSEGR